METEARPSSITKTSRSRQSAPDLDLTSPAIAGTSFALPTNRYRQRDLARLASAYIGESGHSEAAIGRFFERVGVAERYLAMPADDYLRISSFGARNAVWQKVATELGVRTITALLSEAGMTARDVSMLMTTTVTGVAVPSLDARLMNLLPFPTSLKRVPLFGLGCLGGAAGLARASEYLLAFPTEAVILLSVELCSLTFQMQDASVANLVSTGLFGDGASAVLLVGAKHPIASVRTPVGDPGRPRVVSSRSVFFPDTERVMGWDVVDTGFKVVLSPEVPDVVRAHVPRAVDSFLAEHGLARRDIATWVLHPGGPKVIDALEESLALPVGTLAPTREGLARIGNVSSSSVLILLDDYRRRRRPRPGSYGLLMAMGPAFCAEMVLLQW